MRHISFLSSGEAEVQYVFGADSFSLTTKAGEALNALSFITTSPMFGDVVALKDCNLVNSPLEPFLEGVFSHVQEPEKWKDYLIKTLLGILNPISHLISEKEDSKLTEKKKMGLLVEYLNSMPKSEMVTRNISFCLEHYNETFTERREEDDDDDDEDDDVEIEEFRTSEIVALYGSVEEDLFILLDGRLAIFDVSESKGFELKVIQGPMTVFGGLNSGDERYTHHHIAVALTGLKLLHIPRGKQGDFFYNRGVTFAKNLIESVAYSTLSNIYLRRISQYRGSTIIKGYLLIRLMLKDYTPEMLEDKEQMELNWLLILGALEVKTFDRSAALIKEFNSRKVLFIEQPKVKILDYARLLLLTNEAWDVILVPTET